ncbi:MAG TPA: sigma-70 family RNA polymerase sigma factor [Candidatus Limnocylindria bacterium]|nr:sigma-70 family RNA polymerase sigma factor [Candidatus Limnocylindria bacterium]
MRSNETVDRSVSGNVRLPPFQVLVDTHTRELHRYLVVLVGPDAAEDCLQETFVSALRAYPRLRHGENLRAWLYTIAHRKATDTVRKATRHPLGPGLEGLAPGREPSVQAHEPADDGLWATVRALPAKQRMAVVHRYVLDLDYRQIGERMGTSEEAARQNVRAGLRRLRQEMDG